MASTYKNPCFIQLTHTVAIYNIPEPLTTENSDSDKRIPAATCNKNWAFIFAPWYLRYVLLYYLCACAVGVEQSIVGHL